MRDADRILRNLSAMQHGLVTADQAHGLGLTPRDLAHRVHRGLLRWRTRRVLEVVGSAPTTLQARLLRVLDAGSSSALSHGAALEHWGTRGFSDEAIQIVRPRTHLDHKVAGAIVHEVRYLPWDEVRTLDAIRVVTPSLALLQLAGLRSVSDGRLGRAIDAAWADRLVTWSTLTAIDRRMSRQGRAGLRRFRELVEARGPSYIPPASNLEGRLAALLSKAGLPEMRRQVDCGSEAGWIGRVDFRADDVPLVVEVQSERFHRGLLPEHDDKRRIADLERAGFEVLEVVEEDLFRAPDSIVTAVIAARDRALRRLAA